MKDFIPANLALGTASTKNFNEQNKITLGLDVNKLLVPTPPANSSDPNAISAYRKKSVVGSWFSSFGDAPGGFKEELKELQKHKDTSPMPPFAEILTASQMQDLVAYLASLRGVR